MDVVHTHLLTHTFSLHTPWCSFFHPRVFFLPTGVLFPFLCDPFYSQVFLFTLVFLFYPRVFLFTHRCSFSIPVWTFFIPRCSFPPLVFLFSSTCVLFTHRYFFFHPCVFFFIPECSFSPKCVPLLTLCSCTLTLSLLIHCLIYSLLIAQFSHTVEEIHWAISNFNTHFFIFMKLILWEEGTHSLDIGPANEINYPLIMIVLF